MSFLSHSRAIEPTPGWPALLSGIEQLRSCVVAFSGGVDSTLLAKVAHDVLGPKALAALAVSPSLATAERDEARELAGLIGIDLVEVATGEAEDPRYAENTPNRCFFCKSHLFDALEILRVERGLEACCYGAITDDLGDVRPGMDAARQRGIAAPLLTAGIGKAEARQASRRLGLPTWDKPAMACLASRVPHGTPVTADRLARVERAEAAVRALGFQQVRVRHRGQTGRLEVGPAEVPNALRQQDSITRAVIAAGFESVEIDPAGYGAGRSLPLTPADAGAGT